MRRIGAAFAAIVIACTLASIAGADSGSVELTNKVGGSGTCRAVRRGRSCYFAVPTSGSGNSVAFEVVSNRADVCATSDTASTTDRSQEVRIWKVISASTEAGSVHPVDTAFSLTDSDRDCAPLTPGKWWLEVEAAPGAGSGGLVSITGRDA